MIEFFLGVVFFTLRILAWIALVLVAITGAVILVGTTFGAVSGYTVGFEFPWWTPLWTTPLAVLTCVLLWIAAEFFNDMANSW